MQPLRQSTAKVQRIGPFIDETDGITPLTGLTIARADIQISKHGAEFAQTNAVLPTTTHDADGWYQVPFTTTDTGTLGTFTVQLHVTGALPLWKDFVVLPANVYDSLVLDTDVLTADVKQVLGSTLTQGAGGRLAAAIVKLFDVATPALVASEVMRGNDAAAEPGDAMTLAADAIKAASYDESSAFPVKSADTGATQIARTGAGGKTLKTLSDEIAAVSAGDATEARQIAILAALVALQTHGDDNWSNFGVGAIEFTYTLKDADTELPIANVDVWVTTDSNGVNVVASATTNAFGEIPFELDAGTYYLWRQKVGYNFDNPDIEVVA